jgi:cytochrome c553
MPREPLMKVWTRQISLLLLLTAAHLARAEGPTPEQVEFFEKQVRPLLLTKCFECHSDQNEESELRVDSLAELLAGGTRGPAIVPGKPAESLLVRAIGHGETLQMPPKKKLAAAEIADLTRWIKDGAAWPGESAKPMAVTGGSAKEMVFTEAQKSHWAFQQVKEHVVPDIRDSSWCQSPIDRYLLARLEQANLKPAAPADKRVLLRRATFDLTGLPPTLEELRIFLADDSPDAFARVVDRLLASPRYGEKYGRHWLDLARYADSNGLDENLAYANAFRYRDWVIAAFNKDKPYDRLVQEQLAGDLLAGSEEERIEGTAATGFLCIGAKMLAEDDPVKMQMDIIDEQVDTLGKVFLGLTLGCARCHDHKFDPLPARDYYSLAGIFKSTKTMENHSVVAVWQERPLADSAAVSRRDEHRQKIDAKRGEIAGLVNSATDEILKVERKRAGEYLLAAWRKTHLNELLAKAKPLGSLPEEERKKIAGLQLMEMENFARGNVAKFTTSYGEGIGVLVNQGQLPNFAEYDVAIEKMGTYQLELRYAAAGSRPCRILVNGMLAIDGAAGKVTGSWNPDTQTWFIEGFVDLQAGQNTIRVERADAFPHLDKLLIAPASGDLVTTANKESQPLNVELVEQWIKYLEKAKNEPESIFAPWHAIVAGKESTGTLLGEPLPKSPSELAAAYAKAFDSVEEAWQKLKASPEGKDTTKLPDETREKLRQVLYEKEGPFAPPKGIENGFPAELRESLKKQREELAALEAALPKLPEAMAVSDAKPENLRVHIRGSHLTLGDETPRQFPRILAGETQTALVGVTSGRLELAQWMTRAENPLTARVMVNRLWQWHFGEGIVRSSDNFGLLGEKPTHPELLDYLAGRFVDDGWSIKKMHRRMMLSAAYQLSEKSESNGAVDPENRLLSHFARRRLEAEEIRDSLLAVSDSLDCRMGGTQLGIENRKYVTSTANIDPVVYTGHRRSVYLPVIRSALYDVFQAFDFADPSVAIGKRDSTTVAPQALFMMNSQIASNQSRTLSDLLSQSDSDETARIRLLYERAYSRPPTDSEISRSLAFLERYTSASIAASKSTEVARLQAWRALCRVVLSANEFVYVE